jgi:RNA ligase (TIGR02306 family)
MSSFGVYVRKIDDVIDHPNADRLSICKILGYDAITAKDENGNHRFAKGELIVYVPEAAVVPEQFLKQFGYWNDEKNTGMLSGKAGDRVKAVKLRNVLSQGLVWPIETAIGEAGVETNFVRNSNGDILEYLCEGDDVSDFFGITKYEPPIPVGMAGEVASAHEFAFNFDVENYQNFPGFLDNDEVEATEKLHGTCARIAFRPNVTHDELFGSNGCVAISSKGLGAKGLVFKNNDKNTNNLYVRTFVNMGLVEKIEQLGRELNASIDLFGEIFGQGVQDLTYGVSKPEFRAFDIAVDGKFLPTYEKKAMFARLEVIRVPVLYSGPWDINALVTARDGKTTLGGNNIREGIVVTAIGDQTKREWMGNRLRPFLKLVSPAYLTRKGEVTEFQ